MVNIRLPAGRYATAYGLISLLLVSGCGPKSAYKDQPYTPSGKVQFDSLEPQGIQPATSVAATPTVAPQPINTAIPVPPSSSPVTATATPKIPPQPLNTAVPVVPAPSPASPASPASASDDSTAIGPSALVPSPPEPKDKCKEAQTSVLTLKTESYDVAICEENGNLRYYGSYLPSGTETELSALLSDTGYYVKDGRYQYWVTKGSIAIYDGDKLLQEEFAK